VALKFLVIQTSFLGDVILATAITEKLHQHYPDSKVGFLVRKGNEAVLMNNPTIHRIHIWEKRKNKIKNLFKIILELRKQRYDYVFNLHRYFSSGLITLWSGAKFKSGFDANPLSFGYTHKFKHRIGDGVHEVQRNQQLIAFITDEIASSPRIYPSDNDFKFTSVFKDKKYICIAPGSVWATKCLPKEQWVRICDTTQYFIYIIGSPEEENLAADIISMSKNGRIKSLCTQLNIQQAAALMKDAEMNFVNDSAPLHICSAVNAPCTAFFCSTIPEFGFGPLSDISNIVQTKMELDCRPCGIHGFNTCPRNHFNCGKSIEINESVIV